MSEFNLQMSNIRYQLNLDYNKPEDVLIAACELFNDQQSKLAAAEKTIKELEEYGWKYEELCK